MIRVSTIVVLPALCLSVLLTDGGVFAQEGYSWDSVYFKPVQIYYPGQPDTGRMKATLWWSHPDWPYSLPTAAMLVTLEWSGNIVCDSFVKAKELRDSLLIAVYIDNVADSTEFDMWSNPNYVVPRPGVRRLGELFFTIQDTGFFRLDTLWAPYFCAAYAICWFGRFFPIAYSISNPGDFDGNGVCSNLEDVLFLLNFIFGQSCPQAPFPFADANGDCLTNITDVVYLLRHVYFGGSAPTGGCQFGD